MTQSRDNSAQKNKAWTFDPNKTRDETVFKNFENSTFAGDVIRDMEATPLGKQLVDFARKENPVIAFEQMPFFSVYVPPAHNLDKERLNGNGIMRSDRPVILIDDHDTDKQILPFILASQLFRLMMDRAEPDAPRTIPMFQHGIVYNPAVRIDYKNIFVRDYMDMERATDVIALDVLYQMHMVGVNKNAFGYMRAQSHMESMCDWIAQTGGFINKSGIGEADPRMAQDLFLYMSNMASLQSQDYLVPLKKQAEAAFDSTMENPGFAVIASGDADEGYGDDWDFWDDDADDFFDDFDEDGNIDPFREAFLENAANFYDPDDLPSDDYDDDGDDFEGDDNEPPYSPPTHNGYYYSLLSQSYEDRDFDTAQWIEAINSYAESEKHERASRIQEAFKMAAESRKNDDGENAPAPQDKKAKDEAPKSDDPKSPTFKSRRGKGPNGPK